MEDEQIMCIALLKARHLDSINYLDMKTLSSFFNLPSRSAYQQALNELKKSIAYIILIERNDIQDYINLSKFRRLPPYLCAQLIAYIKELWGTFNLEKQTISNSKLKDIQQTNTPREKLSRSFQEVRKGNSNSHLNSYNFFTQYGNNNSERSLNFPPQHLPSIMFPYQNYMGNTLGSTLGSQGSNQVGGTINTAVFDDYNNQGGMVDNCVIQNQSEPQREPERESQGELQKEPEVVRAKQEEMSQKDLHNGSVLEKTQMCFCGESGDQTLIRCRTCDKQFHFKCWQAQTVVNAVCPVCRLNSHSYTKSIGKPVFERWVKVDDQLMNSHKITLNASQMERLDEFITMVEKSGRCWIELRVLKVNTSYEQESKSGTRVCFPFSIGEVKKMQSRQWMQVKFKNNGQGESVIFLLVCSTVKPLPQIIRELEIGADKESSFVNKWLQAQKHSHHTLSVLHPLTKQRIVYPIRGPRCKHIEPQELSVVYDQGIKKQGKIICSYCQQEYSSYDVFECDQDILRLLNQNVQNSEIVLKAPGYSSPVERSLMQDRMEAQDEK